MYNIGYYYHLPFLDYRTKDGLVLCLTDNGFKFFLVNHSLIPTKYNGHDLPYYDLSMPIICTVGENRAYDVQFLMDLPIYDNIDNCTSLSFYVKKSEYSATLYYNRQPVTNLYFESEIEKKLVPLLTNNVVAEKQMYSLIKVITYISANSLDEKKQKVIRDFKRHIDSFDMEKILSSLYVKEWDSLRTKIGDDDTYSIYREAKLLDETIIVDDYIKKTIGLGESCIYRDSGYTNQLERDAEGFLENQPLGIYSGETLEHEKQRILSMYTKEEHMAYLFFEQLEKQNKCSQIHAKWKKTYDDSSEELNKDSLIKTMKSIEKCFFYDYTFLKDPSKFLAKINNYLYRIQHFPQLKVIITGSNIPIIDKNDQYGYDMNTGLPRYESRCFKKIGEALETLIKEHNVIVICGDTKRIRVDNLSYKYSIENKIPTICPSFDDTKTGRNNHLDRAYEIAKMADLIILAGDPDSDIAKNYLLVAKELNIPVKLLG